MIAPFPTPVMFVAGATNPQGSMAGGSIGGALIQKCKAQGFKTVALQITQVTAQQVQWCKDAGLFTVGWEHPGRFTKEEFDALGFDGFCPQVESPDQLIGTLRYLRDGVGAGKPKAIITTYFGFDDGHGAQHWADLEAEGVSACFVECYASDAPDHGNLPHMMGAGISYGIPAAALVPVCGVYRGELPPTYVGISDVGREFGCYIADSMSDAQWIAWGGLNKMTQVYYWNVKALPSGALLHDERAMTYSAGDTGWTRTLKWIAAHEALLKTYNDFEVKRELEPLH
jgi:hypothetical protein